MDTDRTPMTDPDALLERSLIDEFLQAQGVSLGTLHTLPAAQADALLKDASRYASGRLMEVESRARFVAAIKGDVDLTD